MPRRNDAGEYEKLRKIGFEFRGPVDEFSAQPDSSGVIGGKRGAQEYGITGGISTEDLEQEIHASDNEEPESIIELEKDPIPYGEVEGFAGASEWSTAQSQKEEEVIEEEEIRRQSMEDNHPRTTPHPISRKLRS